MAAMMAGASLVGCMTPPVAWYHDARSKAYGGGERALLIRPVADRREASNEEASWLNYVPLVLWTTETDQVFELSLLRNGSRRNSVPNTAIRFGAADLQRAMARQLSAGGGFGPIFLSEAESGPWQGRERQQWSLAMTLNRLTMESAHLRYGLGPFAFLACMFGAPQRRANLAIDFAVVVRDAEGKLRYEDRVESVEYCYDGWYYGLDAEQRLLNRLSFLLGDEMDALQEKCCAGGE